MSIYTVFRATLCSGIVQQVACWLRSCSVFLFRELVLHERQYRCNYWSHCMQIWVPVCPVKLKEICGLFQWNRSSLLSLLPVYFFMILKCTLSELLADDWTINNIMVVVLFLLILPLSIKDFLAKWPKAPLFCFQWWWCGSDESRFFPEARGSLILLRRYKVQWRQ